MPCALKLIQKHTTLPKQFFKEMIAANQGRILRLIPGMHCVPYHALLALPCIACLTMHCVPYYALRALPNLQKGE